MNVKAINVIKLTVQVIWATVLMTSTSSIVVAQSLPVPGTSGLIINVQYKEVKPNDTLILAVDNLLNTALERYVNIFKATINEDGYFTFLVPVSPGQGYFTVLKKRTFTDTGSKQLMAMTRPCFYEKGDSITMQLSHEETNYGIKFTTTFTGRGAVKYNICSQLRTFPYKYTPAKPPKIADYPTGFNGNVLKFKDFDAISDYDQDRLQFLEENRRLISQVAFDVLKADLLYGYRKGLLIVIGSYARDSLNRDDKELVAAFKGKFNESYDELNHYGIGMDGLAGSIEYISFLLTKMRVASLVDIGETSMSWTFDKMKAYNAPEIAGQTIKETLLMLLFMVSEKDVPDVQNLYKDAKPFIRNPSYLAILSDFSSRAPGKDFSHYTFENLAGQKVKLGDFNNSIVLLDFWFTGCGPCADYYKKVLSKVKQNFKNDDRVVFVSISGDGNRDLWEKGVQSGFYTSANAINLYTSGQGRDHRIVEDNLIRGFPCVVLLDRSGKVKFFNTQSLFKVDSLTYTIKSLF